MSKAGWTSFAEALAWEETEPGCARGRSTADWSQGRATFGGLVAALALRQIQRHVDSTRPLRSLSLTFPSPLLTEDASCRSQVLRAGNVVTIVEARIEQGAQLCCVAHAAFASARESVIEVAARQAPLMDPPDKTRLLPYVPGFAPAFFQHVALRWAFGNMPYSATPPGPIGGYCELVGDSERADACTIVALLDAWPSPIFSALSGPVRASTVNWTIAFLAEIDATGPRGPFRFEGWTTAAGGGHAQTEAWLWDASGTALARATQLITVFG